MTELQVLKDNIKVLLKLEYCTDIEIENDYDLLWVICRKYEVELLKNLIQKGFDIDIKNKYGNTALMRASYNKLLGILKLLLENNANPNIQNNFGNNALYWAEHYRNPEIIKLLKKYGAKE